MRRYQFIFVKIVYFAVYGNLPSKSQLTSWEFTVSQHSAVLEAVLDIIQAMPHDAHPMGVLVNAMSALSVFHPNANPALRGQDLYKSKQVRDKQIVRILGKAPTTAAAAYLRLAGRHPVLPSNNLSYSENFLYMLDSLGNRSYKPNPRLARVIDILFILHAEHEMNCSTAAARHLASSSCWCCWGYSMVLFMVVLMSGIEFFRQHNGVVRVPSADEGKEAVIAAC